MSEFPFIPGIELNRLFFQEAVRPILNECFPGLAYTAAYIGYGSDVIGFDTPRSTDHMWGPRMRLFLSEADLPRQRQAVDRALSERLPVQFRGWPTNYGSPDGEAVRLLQPIEHGPVAHLIEIDSLAAYWQSYLGADPYMDPAAVDWLVFEEHKLLALTAGAVYEDRLGLEAVRARFAYYPRDVWLYLLASEWSKIGQEDPFVGRTGDVGDELGSRIIAARLAQYLMHLAFLMERRYAPYSKWFGSGFARLPLAQRLGPALDAVLAAPNWQQRQDALNAAEQVVAEKHNDLGITPALPIEASPFHDRPYRVIHGEIFSEAIRSAIHDEAVLRLPPNLGSINQCLDSVDVRSETTYALRMKALYLTG